MKLNKKHSAIIAILIIINIFLTYKTIKYTLITIESYNSPYTSVVIEEYFMDYLLANNLEDATAALEKALAYSENTWPSKDNQPQRDIIMLRLYNLYHLTGNQEKIDFLQNILKTRGELEKAVKFYSLLDYRNGIIWMQLSLMFEGSNSDTLALINSLLEFTNEK